jgi:branched-subunit amino acid transport protein
VADFLLLVLACGAGTYAFRGLGVVLGRSLDVDSELFRWVSCVAFAMLAGLVARMVLMPAGSLAAAGLGARLAATACTLAAYYFVVRRNIFAAVALGSCALVILHTLAA